MSTQTTNYGLVKPDATEFYDITVQNSNMDKIDTTLKSKADQTEVDSLKKSVSDGKTTVANAITGQGVTTATDATFATMATNIATVGTNKYNAGVTATKKGTATAAQVLSGYTFTNASTVGASGTMSSKSAATYTPGDSAQTIAAGQYLSGVQTISAVPTETKTVTAGTSATTVSRSSGKYMTSVTVNPTPSQTKSVTMTSSPMTVYPDAGNLLSSVTVSASLGRRYATGTTTWTTKNMSSGNACFRYLTQDGTNSNSSNTIQCVILNTDISPSCIRIRFTATDNFTYSMTAYNTDVLAFYRRIDIATSAYVGWFTSNNVDVVLWDNSSKTLYVPGIQRLNTVISSTVITWEVWE